MEKFSHDYGPLARRYELPSLESIHNYNDLVFVSKCIHSNYLPQDNTIFTQKRVHYSNNRHFILDEVLSRSNEVKDSTVHRLRNKWNNISDNLRVTSDLVNFSSKLKISCYEYK